MEHVKPGQKTSELLFSVFVVVMIVFSEKVGITLSEEQMMSLVALAMTYTGGRSVIKAALLFMGKNTESDAPKAKTTDG